MTARQIIEKTVRLSGFSGIEDAKIQKCALTCLNRIYAELFFLENKSGFNEITDVNGEVELDERLVVDVMPYGIASLIALALGDSENHNYYGQIYNVKRKRCAASVITDSLPTV